jgi:uncharacterized protein with GYD domain
MNFVTMVTVIAERNKEAFDHLKKLKATPGVIVKSVFGLFGRYDALIIYEADELKAAMEFSLEVRRIAGVLEAETILATHLTEHEEKE